MLEGASSLIHVNQGNNSQIEGDVTRACCAPLVLADSIDSTLSPSPSMGNIASELFCQ